MVIYRKKKIDKCRVSKPITVQSRNKSWPLINQLILLVRSLMLPRAVPAVLIMNPPVLRVKPEMPTVWTVPGTMDSLQTSTLRRWSMLKGTTSNFLTPLPRWVIVATCSNSGTTLMFLRRKAQS